MKQGFRICICIFFAQCLSNYALSQSAKLAGPAFKDTTIAAGPEYKTSASHQWFWGTNHRADWGVPIKVPIVYLDKIYGGVTPVKAGGGNQTKSLQVETKSGNRYTLRTVNKTLGKVLPKDLLNTFAEDLVNDKVSMSHPYGAAAVPVLANSVKVFHTYPQYVYMPEHKALDTFNPVFGNRLYLLEQKIDGDWRNADNLGNFKDYKGTMKLVDKIREDNDNSIDQKAFLRARLFDFFINDWDRHEDQWEWGELEKEGDKKIFTAVPQDRDQAFFTYNGVMLKLLIGASGLSWFQPFKDDLKNVKTFNYEQRNLDRFFLNELTLNNWVGTAKEMQAALTDQVIENAVKQMPPESYATSGAAIIKTLKARRNRIPDWAEEYYRFIAKEVDIIGSEKHEVFDVKKLNDKETQVDIYKKKKDGERDAKPFYSRIFTRDETKEIRLYGLAGSDVYQVTGTANNNIKLRLIGGVEKDSITVEGRGVHVYDNPDNVINAPNARLHISADTTINSYQYSSFLYSKKGLKPTIFYSNPDRLYVGLAYSILTQNWRKTPFASKQLIQANYSISQKAFSFIYDGLFPKTFGKTDLALHGMYDQINWTNFFGLGNETKFVVDDIDFYRARSEEWTADIGLIRRLGKHTIRLNGNYQQIRVLSDTGKFLKQIIADPAHEVYDPKNFASGILSYTLTSINDSISPTKGITFSTSAAYTKNLQQADRYVARFDVDAHWYIPLVSKFSLAIRAGAQTVTGTPEFYQYATIGGAQQLRAFRAGRYWGKTGVYNSNELRYISDVNGYIYRGKVGLLLFYDNGRVWMPGEDSKVWHDGYGFGVFLAPFNKISADITYGFSRDDRLIQLRISRIF